MEYIVYVLRNEKKKIYIGQTSNLKKRLQEHNTNHSDWTRGKGPWTIVYQETFASRSEAMKREKYLKTGVGRDFLKTIVGP